MSTFSFGFAELLLAGRMRQTGCTETWTFEISLPALPPRRSFLIAAGLEQAVGMLERLAENGPDLAGLDASRLPAPLDQGVLQRVASLRFTGNVEAVPEGTVIFAGEPVVRLRAPAAEAVLVGAALVGYLRSQTAVATKAARLVLAAGGKPVYEIGVRSAVREAALLAARSAHVGGACATANAVAAMEFGLPTMPVIPISLVAALGGMVSGLESCGVMVDGALANEGEAALAALSVTPRAVILDASTPNLAERVSSLRAGIQSLGWRATKVLVGGRVDEDVIDSMESAGIEVDGFCVGGELVVAVDSPCVGFDYELVEREIDGQRIPLPRRDGGIGRRSVWRRREAGRFKSDTVQPESKAPPSGGIPLLVRVMEKGRRLFRAPSLSEVRVLCGSQLSMLDPAITRRTDPATYQVSVTIEPRKAEETAPKAAEAKPAPAPKVEPMRADEARRRALSQIDDSSDFSAVSGAFESVVAANLGDDPNREPPVEPPVEPFDASHDDHAAQDADADATDEAPADDATLAASNEEETAHAESAEDDAAQDEPVPVAAEASDASEESSDDEQDDAHDDDGQHGDDGDDGQDADDGMSDHSRSVAALLNESLTPTFESNGSAHDSAEDDAAHGDDERGDAGEPQEAHEDHGAHGSHASNGSHPDHAESHDLMRDLAAEGLIDMIPSEAPPKAAAQKRGAAPQKPVAVAKAPPAPKMVAPPVAAKPVAPTKPVAAPVAAKPVAPPKVAKPVAPKHVAKEPPMPTFGNDPAPSSTPDDSAEPVAQGSNPLLVAAARLRSLQRGESLPPAHHSAPLSLESAPTPEPTAAAPAESSGNPLLAAAQRLKSMRGS